MQNENISRNILNSIFLIVFNVAFFVVGGIDHKAAAWISYVFIHFAYSMLLLTPKLIRDEENWTALGFSLYLVSTIYFLVELFIGAIFIAISPDGYKAALLIQLCIAGLYGIVLISNKIANEWTAESEEKRQPQISYIKNASIKVKSLMERISDKEAKRTVERVYDILYTSPVKTHPDLESVEHHILQSIVALDDAVVAGDRDRIVALAEDLESMVTERNMRLRAYN